VKYREQNKVYYVNKSILARKQKLYLQNIRNKLVLVVLICRD